MNQIIKIHKLTTFKDKKFKNKICIVPFNTIEIDYNGNVRLCDCDGWMPTTVGNIFTHSLKHILSNELSIKIRESIIDGSFLYCNENTCGVIKNNLLNEFDDFKNDKEIYSLFEDSTSWKMPKDIRIGGDITCNLSCPSCRDSVIDKNNIDKNHNEKLSDLMYKNLFSEPTNKEIILHLSTSGEIFASNLLLNFIKKIEKKEFPNLKLDIQTNGLLMPQRWERLGELSCAVYKITITIDASTKKTYEKLRRGGKWEQIIKSLEWVKNLKNKQDIELNMRMVVQLDNYEEIKNFYIMCKKYCADVVEFVRINNWGSMSSQEFEKIDVFSPLHPKYNVAKNHLNMVKFKEDVLIFGDL